MGGCADIIKKAFTKRLILDTSEIWQFLIIVKDEAIVDARGYDCHVRGSTRERRALGHHIILACGLLRCRPTMMGYARCLRSVGRAISTDSHAFFVSLCNAKEERPAAYLIHMKQFIKKLCLFTLFITAILPLNAESFQEGEIVYTVLSEEDKTVEASWMYATADVVGHELVLPSETSNGYKVVKIASYFCSHGERICDQEMGLFPYFKSVVIPETVTEIEEAAFFGNRILESAVLPQSLTVIEKEVFYRCYALRNINIPHSVTSIKDRAFYACKSLVLDCETFPQLITDIGNEAFAGCQSFNTVTLPASIKTVGEQAFYSCINLNKLMIKSSNLVIGGKAFRGCKNLNELIIDSQNIEIKDETFMGCTEIIKIECYSEIPPTCRYRAFADVNKELCRLYVPKGSEDLYRDAYQWMEFQQIYATLEHSSLERIEDTDKDKDVIAVYDVNGRLTTPDMPGIVIKRYSDGSVKKVFNN